MTSRALVKTADTDLWASGAREAVIWEDSFPKNPAWENSRKRKLFLVPENEADNEAVHPKRGYDRKLKKCSFQKTSPQPTVCSSHAYSGNCEAHLQHWDQKEVQACWPE